MRNYNFDKFNISGLEYEKYGCINCGAKYTIKRIHARGRFIDNCTCQECGKEFGVCDNKSIIKMRLVSEFFYDMNGDLKNYSIARKRGNVKYDKIINKKVNNANSFATILPLLYKEPIPMIKPFPRYMKNNKDIVISKVDFDSYGCIKCDNYYCFDKQRSGQLVENYTCKDCGQKFGVCSNRVVTEYNLVENLREKIEEVDKYYYGKKNRTCSKYEKDLKNKLDELFEENKELEKIYVELPKIVPHPKKHIKSLKKPFPLFVPDPKKE